MSQFEELWMYCKETFGIVKQRLVLFVPRLIMTGLFMALVFIMVGSAFLGILQGRGVLGMPLAVVMLGLVTLVGNLVVESGQIGLFSRAALGYSIGMKDFGEGIGKYTGRVFAGGILFILLFLIIALSTLILFVIPVLDIVAAIGMVVVMLLVSVFLSAWKAALAFKDLDVMEAFRDSYRFAREFFWPMALVVFVRGLFDGSNNNKGGEGDGGSLSVGGINLNINLPGINIPGVDAGTMLEIGSVAALLAVIPIAAAAAIISTVLTVYIDQMVFVIYARRENISQDAC
ncbi:MAG TPA: hypothetical protein VFF83_01175 [Clostridia bacterium]|nr:hypothetical protein [Clostridia bacterium]